MALYHYSAATKAREDHTESGTVFARNEEDARKKLRALRFDHIHLRKITGLRRLIGRFTANVR